MGEGKPHQIVLFSTPCRAEIINNRQFSGLFDAGLTALARTSDVSATFVFFNTHNLKRPEICLFRTCRWPHWIRGNEGSGEAWPGGRASSFSEPA